MVLTIVVYEALLINTISSFLMFSSEDLRRYCLNCKIIIL